MLLLKRINKDSIRRYLQSLRFALYCMTHPLDGFWDLTHEKRGTFAAANTIVILTVVARIASLQFTSFLFIRVYWEGLNILLYIASILVPLALWCVGNWGITSLFEGKGRLTQVYMGTAYALAPYPLIQIPMMILSNFVTVEEGAFYMVAGTISLLWCGMLILCAMMQIHEYRMGQIITLSFFSILAMLIIIFIMLLFFSMITQGIAYFVSIAREIMFRL